MNVLRLASKPGVFVNAMVLMLIFIFSACKSLTLTPADFSWPIESVLKVDQDGFVKEERHNIIFNTKELFLAETNDSSAFIDKDVRVIRDSKGYIYMTANNFKNVYVFENGEGELCLENKVLISETGVANPAFNQLVPNIELIDGDKKYLLTNDGIKENDEK